MFTESFQVELSPEFPEGSAIRYTTDGSIPTAESTLYTQPIEITTTTRIRARTFAEGWQAGPIEQETWLKAGDDVKAFSSNLPLVVLDSLGFNVNGDATRRRHHGYSVVVDVDADTGQSSLLGDPDYAGNMGFNVRGQTSGNFPKKSYRLEVIN
ncbi:MAG: chitobiase/beta-hexosaminidase C-terminal domain-containing protein, partial [Opitutae bacterium]